MNKQQNKQNKDDWDYKDLCQFLERRGNLYGRNIIEEEKWNYKQFKNLQKKDFLKHYYINEEEMKNLIAVQEDLKNNQNIEQNLKNNQNIEQKSETNIESNKTLNRKIVKKNNRNNENLESEVVLPKKKSQYNYKINLICPDKKLDFCSTNNIKIGTCPSKSGNFDLLTLNGDYISGNHAEIIQTEIGFMIKDLNSTNGIYFKVSEIGVNLKVGMILELGYFLYKVNKAKNKKLEMSPYEEIDDLRNNEKAMDNIIFDFENNNEIIYEKSNPNYIKYFENEKPKIKDLAILTLNKKNYNMKPTSNTELWIKGERTNNELNYYLLKKGMKIKIGSFIIEASFCDFVPPQDFENCDCENDHFADIFFLPCGHLNCLNYFKEKEFKNCPNKDCGTQITSIEKFIDLELEK